MRCVAVRREWIRVTAPGSNVTEIGSCRIGIISEFDRFLCVKGPCATGGAVLRAVHHAWGLLAGRSLEGTRGNQVNQFGILPDVPAESVEWQHRSQMCAEREVVLEKRVKEPFVGDQ